MESVIEIVYYFWYPPLKNITMYRQGATGALLDVYENAIADLKKLVESIPGERLTIVFNPDTDDENCRSVQTILSHVVNSGYGYATSIRNLKGNNSRRPPKIFHFSASKYMHDLDEMFLFTEKVFSEITDADLEQFEESLKMKTGWGQTYDIEQLMEHAIVHVLRHKRQISKINWAQSI
jgi:uncharacterized damage-inducible protein DinB